MQKILRLASVIGLVTLLLAACGGQQTTTPQATTAPVTQATTAPADAVPTAESAAAPTADAAAPTADAAAPTADAAAPTPEPPTAVPDALGSGSTKIVIWHRWEGEYYKAIKQIFADYATKNNVQIELL